MRVYNRMRRIPLFLMLAVLLVQTASALLVGTSFHYDGYTIFDGTLSNGKDAKVMIEFAVYDKDLINPGTGKNGAEEFEAVFTGMGVDAPDTSGFDQYIYAYKIFNHSSSDDMISYFGILDIDEHENGISGLGAYDDGTDGAQPSDYGFDGGDCFWEWFGLGEGDDSLRFINLGDQSWLLVYSSMNDWVPGEYELRGTEQSTFPKANNEVPEPTVVMLLGAGGTFLFRRKRSIKS